MLSMLSLFCQARPVVRCCEAHFCGEVFNLLMMAYEEPATVAVMLPRSIKLYRLTEGGARGERMNKMTAWDSGFVIMALNNEWAADPSRGSFMVDFMFEFCGEIHVQQ